MKRSHFKLANAIAIFGLLAVMLILWKPVKGSERNAESVDSQYGLCTTGANSFLRNNRTDRKTHTAVREGLSSPLWLLNHSLLI